MSAARSLSAAERHLRYLGVTAPRDIDLEVVARARGASVTYRPLQGAEAHIQGQGDEAVITVNSLSLPERQRYSLAHELGHWHHHRGQRLFCRGDEASVWKKGKTDPERSADAYAADLLMPSFLFVPAAEACQAADINAVRALGKPFGTSLTATAIRLIERGPFPALVAWFDKSGMFGWARRNHRLLAPEVRLLPRLHQDTAAFDVLYGGRATGKAAATRADAWVLGSWGRLGAFQVTESSALVNEGALIVLWFHDSRLLETLA